MDEEVVDALDELLTLEEGSTSFEENEVPEILERTEYIDVEIRYPTRCPIVNTCRDSCEYNDDGSEVIVQCDAGHEGMISESEYTFYDINFESVILSIADHLE